MKRVAILTGGGDCPGLNAVIRAVVRRALAFHYEVVGVREGWRGFVDQNYVKLTMDSVSGILHTGGTILGTSRTNPFKDRERLQRFLQNIEDCDLVGIIAVGGEDTLGVAAKLSKMHIPVVGVPKTIDNDLPGTDFTFGFDTAVTIATEAIDRLHTTAESHNRVMVVEVMGRHAGWIATFAGMAGGADYILIPEEPFNIDDICKVIKKRHHRGKYFSIIVVSEGATMRTKGRKDKGLILSSKGTDEFGHVRLGGIGTVLGQEIERRTGYETRVTVLGHIQRGGSPTAHDRVLATRYGILAMECVRKGKFGRMVALQGHEIVDIPIASISNKIKTVDKGIYNLAKVFFS
ncbi:MAG: pyrophosphate--fructose-6-phosphate 1-phosphotransferase [Deltaproteobacteria bacterium RIFCSPHIGHO2_02_FULL_50_15]|nr:MAG: pyrophosphate--fructose-6-phosphate 1-phosphotransferase [Deltaproteobacteria bacterium RIFCSPHIGHO2_02_FULL_50_15]